MRDVVHELPRSMNAMPAVGLTAPPVPLVPVERHFKTGYDKGAYLENESGRDRYSAPCDRT